MCFNVVSLPQWNGIFSTTREAIRSKPLDWWKNLWEHLTDRSDGTCMLLGLQQVWNGGLN